MAGKSEIEWTGHRRCSRCRNSMPLEAFPIDRSRLHGRGYVCRACRRITPPGQLNWRDHSIARANGQAWCGGCQRFWQAVQIRNSLCPDHRRQNERDRYRDNPTYRAARRQHAHARKRGVEPVPVVGQEFLFDIFDGLCAYCDNPATTWDHVIPITKDGRTEPGNILPCCVSCNSSKGNRDLFPWLMKTGRSLKHEAAGLLAHHQVIHD